MKAVITVIGKDRVGIVHEATGVLVNYNLNIIDITQTIMNEYFTMIMLVDLSKMNVEFDEVIEAFDQLADKIGMSIKVQHEDLFNSMHQV